MSTTDATQLAGGALRPALARPALEVRSHPDCALHRPPPGHPDSPQRLAAVLDAVREAAVAGLWSLDECAPIPDPETTEGVLRWVHDAAYLERVRGAAARGTGAVDCDDCAVSAGSFAAARAAAGLALNAALDLANDRARRVFLALRPPSHHAESDRARGYCFFNSVALAAEVLARSWVTPVLIVDFDAHHGNGTQQIFYTRGDVGYVSVHAYPSFPGTGTADEVGEGAGYGATRNLPVAPGSGDDVVCTAFEAAVEEVGARLRPAVIVASAGFDGHGRDPVGELQLSEDGIRRLSRTVVEASEAWSGGRLLSILEGGFHPRSVADSVRIHLREMAGVGWTN